MTAENVLKIARKYIGVQQYSSEHKELVRRYNQVKPRPAGYQVQYSDHWCDVFVTVVADEAGASHLIGRECGVERHRYLMEKMGIWLGRKYPQSGDLVIFDWDGGGFSDHIGYVETVSGEFITTIEGNTHGKVGRNRFRWNDWRIVGYGRPNYTDSSTCAAKCLVKKVKVSLKARQWATGQKIASWVLGQEFDCIDRQTMLLEVPVLLLENQGIKIGWIREADVDRVSTR